MLKMENLCIILYIWPMFSLHTFNLFLIVMAALAVIVFFSLFFVNAGYGKFYTPKWGPSIDNHLGWMLMEAPVFFVTCLRTGWNSYEVHFEKGGRDLLDAYVRFLEKETLSRPDQWYQFYKFFSQRKH